MWKNIQYLQWKNLWRSQRLGTGIAARIFMGFFILYFGAIFLVLGLFFTEAIDESDLADRPLFALHKFVFYYLLLDIVLRVIFQEVSEVKFRQLALLPIRKRKIVQYILGGSVFSLFNILPLVFLLPVALSTMKPEYGLLPSIIWLVGMFAVLLFNNFLALQIKHFISGNPLFYVVSAGLAGLIYFLDSLGIIPFSTWFFNAFIVLTTYLWPLIIVLALTIGIYYLVEKRMLNQAYVSGSLKSSASLFEKLNFSGLSTYGFFGTVAQLNMQLMFRNKRIRTQVIFGLLFLLYGLFLYSGDRYGPTFLLFWGLYMTGIIVLSFAQYIWSYQGSYFELLNTLPMSTKQYLNAQYTFLIVACLVTTIPSMLYYFMNPDIPKINTAAFFFNVGVNIPFLLMAATYNKRKLETNTAGTFNMQGVNGAQFMFIFIVLLAPVFIYLPFSVLGYKDLGLLIVGGIGLLGLLFKPLTIRGITALFNEKKYALTEGYRSN